MVADLNASPDQQTAHAVPLFVKDLRRKIMIDKVKLALIAIAVSSIALPAAALARSAYTTGSPRVASPPGIRPPMGQEAASMLTLRPIVMAASPAAVEHEEPFCIFS
jgi:hypothetical protein